MGTKNIRVAVDIGGTFTDLQVLDLDSGTVHDFKSPSTPHDPSEGLITALNGAATRFDFALSDITMLLHGSTIATNAVLERKLPEGALLTTAGFTDVLEIGRHMRHNVYALKAESRSLLIPRQRRFGITERIRASGEIETPLDAGAVRTIGERLVGEGVSTVAIAFLHAYRNPSHEQQAADILAQVSGLSISTSHEVSPEIREFERISTTVLNALLKPVISGYLERLAQRLSDAGVSAQLYLVQSNGGVALPDDAARLPVKLLLSGPAGGAMAMARLAREHNLLNMVGIDMGGTSSDVSVVTGGQVDETGEGTIDGLPVRLPMIEIRTIGAGGGSIAHVVTDALRVGPKSAGSMPGPACYGRGGSEPTVTDANLLLGRIDAESFLGGEMQLDKQASGGAIKSLSEELRLSQDDAARGIVDVANASMANAVRLSLFEKGSDPADYVLAPFGGAGGLHACAIAEELDIDRVLFPATASTLSAGGILTSDLRHDLSHSELFLLDGDAAGPLNQIVRDLHAQASKMLDVDNVTAEQRQIKFSADCRYRGQAYEIVTSWPQLNEAPHVDATAIDALKEAFHRLHLTRYAHSAPDEPVEIVTIRAIAIGLLGRAEVAADAPATSSREVETRSRQINLRDGWRDTAVRHRDTLGSEPIDGPVLIEEAYSSLLIEAGWAIRAVGDGCLMAVRQRENAA
ncbi:MAG: N-methylhydantoinase A [Hyphomicrobiaceae bacterium]|jgi:N-methylhydantoinase A